MHCIVVCFQMADIYMTVSIGGTVHFAQPDALKVNLINFSCSQLMEYSLEDSGTNHSIIMHDCYFFDYACASGFS